MKLVALYKQPADPAAFDKAYFEGHVPLIEKVPGLQGIKVTRFKKALVGEGLYLMAEMFFADKAALNAGLASPEMAAAGEDINRFAKGLMTLMIAEEV